MKAVSSNFKEELKTYGREFDDIITYNNNTLNQEDLISVILSYDCSLLKTQMKCLKINCNTSIDIGTIINYQLGLKVNGNYEYIDYGNYIVKEVEEEKNTNSYLITCYDKMLLTMVDYQSIREYTATTDSTFQDNKKYYIYTIEDEYILYTGPTTGNPFSLNLYEDTTYPVNLQTFVTRICNQLGITFSNRYGVKRFTNYDKLIEKELYATYNSTTDTWENNNYTFRDVLDDIAEATGSFIIINDNDELEIKTPNKNLLNTSSYVRKYINNGIIDDSKYAMFTTSIKISDINIHRSYYFTSKQNVYKFYIYCYDSDNSYLGSVSSATNVSSYNFVPEVLVFGNSIDHILLGINYDNSHDITDTIINNLELQFEKTLLDYARIDYQPYNVEIIDEEYFDDNNVNVGKKYGPINVLALSNSNIDYYEMPNVTNDRVVLKINDNPILSPDIDYTLFLDGIYDNVSDIEYYIGNFNTKGLLYYELGDYMNLSLRGTTYRCLMLNDEITKTSGLKEYIYIDEPEANVSDYQYIDPTRKAYFLADKANGLAEMIVEGIGSNGEVTGASVIASINDDTSQLKLNADKIYINGVTFDQNQTMTMTEGSILIEQRPDEQNSIYTYRNYPDDHEIHEASLVPEGMLTDIRDTNTDNMIMLGEYYASNFRVQDNSNNMIYGDATNLSMINSNHDTTFEVDGPTGDITTKGKIVIPKDSTKGIFNTDTYKILSDYANQNIVLNATGAGLFLGYENSTFLDFMHGKGKYDTDGNFKNDGIMNDTFVHTSTGANTGLWCKLANLKYTSHQQGEFTHLKIMIGRGQSSSPTDNAYIDLYMQVGYIHNADGRLGCYALLNPLESSFTTTNTKLKVIFNSNLDYDIWFYTSVSYVRPSVVYSTSKNATITKYYTTQASEPSGTACSLTYKAININTITNPLPAKDNNSNGYYIRFPNLKLQICYYTKSLTTGTSTSSLTTSGNVYYKTDTWTYPVAFSSAPIVIVGALDNASGVYGACNDPPTTSSVGVTIYGPASNRSSGYSAIAIGPYS